MVPSTTVIGPLIIVPSVDLVAFFYSGKLALVDYADDSTLIAMRDLIKKRDKFNASCRKTMIDSRSLTVHAQSPTFGGTVLKQSNDLDLF